jgi:hypothetical protein
MEKVKKKKAVILCVTHHHQNRLESTWLMFYEEIFAIYESHMKQLNTLLEENAQFLDINAVSVHTITIVF